MNDETFMQRSLALATLGVGRTGENPSVGCVVVRDGMVVGEGATADGGRPHAEERALEQAGAAARGAVVYVTLEPCAKRSAGTTACADLLIAAGVVRVVIAASDPHPFAAGAGVARLRAAGVLVEIGLCEADARALNAEFFSRLGEDQPDSSSFQGGRTTAALLGPWIWVAFGLLLLPVAWFFFIVAANIGVDTSLPR